MKKFALTLFLLWIGAGYTLVAAEDVYYVYLQDGGVQAFPLERLVAAPQTDSDGTLRVMLSDGQTLRYTADAYTDCTNTPPALPFLTSFKFNNKYNLHLHKDVEVADTLLPNGQGTSLTLVLNAIGKRLTPSFKTSDKSAIVYAEGQPVVSKESRLRFDHDITFTVTYPGYVQLTGTEGGRPLWEPFGTDYPLHTEWLTDNPNNVPRIDIDINGGKTVKDKTTFLPAAFRLTGNGVYDDLQEEVWIRGRGNDSWNWPKKPYRLKFDTKVRPFGLTAGKSWVLLSNYYRFSMLANPIAMKIAQLIGAPCPNHIIPVELYINGVYQGSYQFTEKVGFGANSIDGDATKGYLLEFDTYYDEPYRFLSAPYDLPVNIKEPDLTEWESGARSERFNTIQAETNALMTAISRGSDEVSTLLNVPSFARFLFAYEYTNNLEIYQPKSVYAYREDLNDPDGQLIYGPLWDFDWAYGGGGNRTNYWINPTEYAVPSWANKGAAAYRNDMKSLGTVQYHYYKLWSDFMTDGSLDELCEFVQDYYTFAQCSFEHNATKWDDGKGYAGEMTKIQNWLRTRAAYIYKKQPVFDISDYDTFAEGDVNGDGQVTVTDAYLVFSFLMGDELEDFHETRADVNHDRKTNVADVTCIVRRALAASRLAASSASQSAREGTLQAASFEASIGECVDIPITVQDVPAACCAMQLDVLLPDGLALEAVTTGCLMADFTLTTHALADNRTRILILPNTTGATLSATPLTLHVRSHALTAASDRVLQLSQGRMTTTSGEEHSLHGLSLAFEQTTNQSGIPSSALHVSGGRGITISALEEQEVTITAVDGRVVQKVQVHEGDNYVEVPSGIYLVAGKKVVVL